ncbi:hypothetical protein [Sinanaerobacter sp. ZZT-01]|uniref:hypothetical protein n=1 Tax=Sinanaerobacter sp. ZZT-01 TaxID=3111540 RepID=UPI002D79A2A8|nr:hypothetical protein [Sinanaerobacter sp. ZZT-01]WRR94871.1 hypothetical protein U5921_07065 [Sinanaerobacter sp. ZZT-01]
MVNGTYKITLQSPLGPRHGTLTLLQCDSSLSGSVDMLSSHTVFENGSVHDNHFSFTTEMHTLLGNKLITVTGLSEGDALVGFLSLSLKKFPFTGERCSLE